MRERMQEPAGWRQVDLLLRHRLLQHHSRNFNFESQKWKIRPEEDDILRPSCVADPPSGTGAVTMKNSDYGAP